MAISFFERIQAKIELFRLEQRYTLHRHRRSTFQSTAIYVDGEYVYNTPNSTGNSNNTTSTNASKSTIASQTRKTLHRFSSIPVFGSASSKNSPPVVTTDEWRGRRNSLDDIAERR